ncbi:hypothetical protein [Agaribacterium haliotis]|uniref:hypothetical protein n=1 Tax=Agaribacterium haliotis TaxID=2013869 RepID=UPI00117870AB|nr:hypothetical protein [Agaribacterium haliotis]
MLSCVATVLAPAVLAEMPILDLYDEEFSGYEYAQFFQEQSLPGGELESDDYEWGQSSLALALNPDEQVVLDQHWRWQSGFSVPVNEELAVSVDSINSLDARGYRLDALGVGLKISF